METGILLLCLGLGTSALIVGLAYAHRIVTETKIKEKVFERSFSEQKNQEVKIDELSSRLEEFRHQRFGRPMAVSQDVRSSIAARIKAEEILKKGG